jgi:hypothetical protein
MNPEWLTSPNVRVLCFADPMREIVAHEERLYFLVSPNRGIVATLATSCEDARQSVAMALEETPHA